MIVTMENRGFFGNLLLLRRCHSRWAKVSKNRIVLTSRGPISALHLMGLIGDRHTMSSLDLWIPVRYLWPGLAHLHNTSGMLRLGLLVDSPLTKSQWKRICRLRGVVPILDSSGKNQHLYAKNRAVLAQKPGENTFENADLFRVAAGLEPAYTRPGTGEGVRIAKDGTVTPVTEEAVPAEALRAAQMAFEYLLGAEPDLSNLPLYQEIALLEHLCGLRKTLCQAHSYPQSAPETCRGCPGAGRCPARKMDEK